ncbi:hypothetical protein GF378_02480 [Candidatus Pacearchaeota archaeon]|nr:hypothetical protein [Candidatus Pacearchaeota archaeon]
MAKAKKRKKFFPVNIPVINKEIQILGYSLENLEGRQIKYDLTRVLRGKSTILNAKVRIKDDNAVAVPTKIKLMPYYLKRKIRKGTNYVEDSFSTECKDAKIRIKPFLITRRKVSRAVRKTLRQKARKELQEYAKSKNSEEIFKDVLQNDLQKPLSLKLKKTYPLSLCEIRVLKVEEFKDKKTSEKKKKNTKEQSKSKTTEKEPEKKTEKAKDAKE